MRPVLLQEMMLEQGIALVLNVSLEQLDRLALCLGCEVRRKSGRASQTAHVRNSAPNADQAHSFQTGGA